MKPVRVQLSRKKGWRMPPNTVKVARPTKWGNPFQVSEHGLITAINRFKDDICHPNSRLGFSLADIEQLRGKNLACFCPLDQPCHADILLEIANG